MVSGMAGRSLSLVLLVGGSGRYGESMDDAEDSREWPLGEGGRDVITEDDERLGDGRGRGDGLLLACCLISLDSCI